MSDYTLSNIDGILAAVTAQLAAAKWRIVCEVGRASDAAHGAAPRIVWIPVGPFDFEPIVQRPADGEAYEDALERWTVRVWGPDYTQARALLSALKLALNTLFGARAQQARKAKPAPESVSASGFGFDLEVVLRVPEYRYLYRKAVIETHEVQGTVQTKPLDSATPGQTTEISA